MSTYKYNQYQGPETISKEYKLFTLHPKGTNIDPNDEVFAENLIKSGKWIFNQPVLDNINFYIENYLPKYTAAFLNKKSEILKGEMYFGITNDGYVQGIPYFGDINQDKIKEKVLETLKSNLLKSSSDLSKYVSVEIIKVDTTDFQLKKSHNKIIENYFFQKKKYNSSIRKYNARKKIWCRLMDYFGSKLHILLNSPQSRKQFLNYVIEKDPTNEKIINLIKSNVVFNPISGYRVHKLKNDKSTIWYWITNWKDYMSDHVKEFKPKTPTYTQRLFPMNIIITSVDMIPHWLDKSNINLYLIKFSFIKPDFDIEIKYKSIFEDEYVSCFRNTYQDEEPYCHPFEFL